MRWNFQAKIFPKFRSLVRYGMSCGLPDRENQCSYGHGELRDTALLSAPQTPDPTPRSPLFLRQTAQELCTDATLTGRRDMWRGNWRLISSLKGAMLLDLRPRVTMLCKDLEQSFFLRLPTKRSHLPANISLSPQSLPDWHCCKGINQLREIRCRPPRGYPRPGRYRRHQTCLWQGALADLLAGPKYELQGCDIVHAYLNNYRYIGLWYYLDRELFWVSVVHKEIRP